MSQIFFNSRNENIDIILSYVIFQFEGADQCI